MILPGWFPSEMTTGGSDDNNESASQEDTAFQKEMSDIGARVPPGRMGKSEDLASVGFRQSPKTPFCLLTVLANRVFSCWLRTTTSGA